MKYINNEEIVNLGYSLYWNARLPDERPLLYLLHFSIQAVLNP